MAVSQYLAFGTGGSANTLSYATYSALSTLIANGFQPGVALSEQVNTVLRQVTVGVGGVAKFAADYGGADVNDDGSIVNFETRLIAALNVLIDNKQGWKTGDVKGTTDTTMANHPGWIKGNGAIVSRTGANAGLFALYGTTFGAGDGSTTFQLPDLRGEFLRGTDDGRGVDPSRGPRTFQAQQTAMHKHVMAWGESNNTPYFGRTNTAGKFGNGATPDSDNYLYHTNDGSDYDGSPNAAGVIGAETRPRNFSVLWLIKL